MAKYLVTGGAGFIGSHLVDSLISQGHEVSVLDNLSTGKTENIHPGAKFIFGDLRNREIVNTSLQNMDGCFHLAAIASVQKSVECWVDTHEVNITGCLNIFDAAHKVADYPIPVVYASSAAVYGDNAKAPITEQDKVKPLSAYGADKLSCELHARVAGLVHNIPTCGFRFFNVYGPRQDPHSPYSGVISIFTERLTQNKNLTIFGDGTQSRDFIYVNDIVRFLTAGMQYTTTKAPLYNACTGIPTSIFQLANCLSNIAKTTSNIEFKPARVGDIHLSLGDPTIAKRLINVSASTTLEDGLKQTYNSLLRAKPMKKAS